MIDFIGLIVLLVPSGYFLLFEMIYPGLFPDRTRIRFRITRIGEGTCKNMYHPQYKHWPTSPFWYDIGALDGASPDSQTYYKTVEEATEDVTNRLKEIKRDKNPTITVEWIKK